MRVRAAVTAVLVALVAAALLPAGAAADDAGLVAAYRSHSDELQAAGQAYVRAAKRARRNPTRRRIKAVIATDRRLNRILAAIGSELDAQEPSSDNGRRAKAAALEEIGGFIAANRLEMRSLRAVLADRIGAARRLIRMANRRARAAFRSGREARQAFRDAGLDPGRGVTQG
jgi:hypothetical protein